jgi:hypothetical protein
MLLNVKEENMDPKDLVKIWNAPDNSKLTPKQWSIRLPIHVAAKINALCDIYPRKSKTEIIGDLLATALDQLEGALPYYEGEVLGEHPETGEDIREMFGTRRDYSDLYQKHLKELKMS